MSYKKETSFAGATSRVNVTVNVYVGTGTYYKRWDDNHLTNGEIGELFGCSESTVEKKFSAKPDELEKIYSMIETKLTQEKTEKASPKSKKKKTADALPDEADDLGEDEADELDEPDADEFPEEDDDSEEPEE